jgi:glycosyltransferase involved in cell wall biosynthesis
MGKNKKYWFISEFYWPVENSTGHIMTRIVDAFTQKFEAHVITVGHIDSAERNQNIHTVRVKDLSFLDKNKLLQRLIKLIGLSFRVTVSVLRNVKRGDIVVTVTNPAPVIVFLSCIKKIKRFKLIIIVHDVFPENLVVSKIVKTNSLSYEIVRKVFDFTYNMADVLITCGRDMQKTISQKVKNKNKVLFIPNFGDNDILYPIDKRQNEIIQKFQLAEKLVVFFTGNIGRMQNVDNIIKTAELLKEDPSIVFLFIGNGVFQDAIENYSRQNSNMIFLSNMSRQKSLIFLNAGDIGLSTLLPNIMGVGVPSKTYSYMATGKPIIAAMDKDSEIAMMIQEEGNGWTIEANNPIQFATLLKQIKKHPDTIREKGQISFNLSNTKYSIETITDKYIQAIINLRINENK